MLVDAEDGLQTKHSKRNTTRGVMITVARARLVESTRQKIEVGMMGLIDECNSHKC